MDSISLIDCEFVGGPRDGEMVTLRASATGFRLIYLDRNLIRRERVEEMTDRPPTREAWYRRDGNRLIWEG